MPNLLIEREGAIQKTSGGIGKTAGRPTIPKQLANFDAHTWHIFAREVRLLRLHESDNAIFRGMDRKIAAHVSTWASNLSATGLAHENFAVANSLATKTLHTEALAGIVVDVFGGTASFDM